MEFRARPPVAGSRQKARRKVWRSLSILGCLAVLGVLLSVRVEAAEPPTVAGATYIGSEQCKGCHEEQAKKMEATLHGRILGEPGRTALQQRGCEACHGPGSKHLEDVTNPANNIRFGPKSIRSATDQNAVCLQCHQKGKRLFWAGSQHEGRDVSCTTCHSIKSPQSPRAQLKAPDQLTLCKQCHAVFVAQQMNWSHMPVREGKLQCTSCHNPHGTITEKLIPENSVNELCYRCHLDKRGPFLWEHPPVRENCLNCHKPHGSNNIRLLRIREPRLCQQCHNEGGHPRTAFAGGTTADPAQDRRFIGRSCALCHSFIHGSNHPRGFMFQR
ncbi:MAG TPA: DmsE family decaheme c-type cytochrome [Dehalococcoidia bacterium]|nr:DmsE family decaheme c-type cytochrome [Dehalococcoidia bacterium]